MPAPAADPCPPACRRHSMRHLSTRCWMCMGWLVCAGEPQRQRRALVRATAGRGMCMHLGVLDGYLQRQQQAHRGPSARSAMTRQLQDRGQTGSVGGRELSSVSRALGTSGSQQRGREALPCHARAGILRSHPKSMKRWACSGGDANYCQLMPRLGRAGERESHRPSPAGSSVQKSSWRTTRMRCWKRSAGRPGSRRRSSASARAAGTALAPPAAPEAPAACRRARAARSQGARLTAGA